MQGIWSGLRRLPAWAQVVAWLLVWPLLLAVILGRGPKVAKLVAVALAVVGTPVWAVTLVGGEADTPRPLPEVAAPEVAYGQPAPTADATPRAQPPAKPARVKERRTPAPATTPAPPRGSGVPGVPAGAQRGIVERIVDGDTIWVRVDDSRGPLAANATHKIRLLEIDTPETVHPNIGVQCGGPEASAFAAELMPAGSPVYLEADREDTDRYGRYLRYVYLPDGRMFNELAVRRGHATAVLYPPNDRHIERMKAAEAEARDAGRGQWGICGAGGAPAAAPVPVAPKVPAAAQPQGSGCDPNYRPCVPLYPPDVNCSAVNGPVTVIGSDPHGLDGDGDGTACE